MSQSPQQIAIPSLTVAKLTFNIMAMIGVQWDQYEVGVDGREITLLLAGPHTHTFVNEDADDFKLWHDQATGQARIQPVTGILK